MTAKPKKQNKIKAWAMINKCSCEDCKISPQLLGIEFGNKPKNKGYIIVPCIITYTLPIKKQ